MKDTQKRNVKTAKEFKQVYFPRLTAEETSAPTNANTSYVKQLVSKSLDHTKK